MRRPLFTKLFCAASICLGLSSPAFSALVAERTTLSGGDRLYIVSSRAVDRNVDVHVGFLKGQGTPIFDSDAFGNPLPAYEDVSLAEPLILANFTVPFGLEPGLYVFYEVLTKPGGDPNNVQDWAFGLSSLSQLALYLDVASELSGDFDDDGSPDDDANGDGFRDDDRNLDGLVETIDLTGASGMRAATPVSVSREFQFANTGKIPGASGKFRHRSRVDGVVDFEVEAEDLPEGVYQILVDGVAIADMQVVVTPGGTEGEVEFRNPVEPGKLPLPFSPVGARIEIADAFGTYLAAEYAVASPQSPSGPAGGGTGGSMGQSVPSSPIQIPADATEIEVPLVNSGVQPAASGDARYRVDDDGDTDFKVEVEDLTVGAYGLFVGNVNRGTIQVMSIPGGTEGELEYAKPSEPGKLPLNFSPRGAAVEVRDSSGRNVLSIRFPN
jgi:hypothetical protein